MKKRVFKTKTFARWAKKLVPDDLLCQAAREIERGEFEADLGQGVCKKRIALPGQGKSGGTRSLVAKQHKSAVFFLAGREKSDPGTDFSIKEEEAAKFVGKGLQSATLEKLDELKINGVLTEICHDQENKSE
ncbi:MAG: type II toxin-antitoxin system RelE/ParE family toxin [Telluria sp.]